MFATGTTSTHQFPQDFGWANDGWTSSPSQHISPRELCRKVKSYVTTPLAIAAVVPFVFRGLQWKSARQLEQKLKASVWESFSAGFKAAPVLGATIGFQLAVQRACEYYGLRVRDREATLWETAASTVMAAGTTAPLLAGFNRMTAPKVGETVFKAFMNGMRLNPREFASLLGRESTFLGAMVVTPQVREWVKSQFGDSWYAKCGSSFAVGVVGAAMGHPFDTALTRAQNGKTVTLAVLPLGFFARSATIGFLNVGVDVASELLNSLDREPIVSP